MGFTAGTTLTLDAEGDEDAVFIIQVGGALPVGASAQVTLVGDADPCNVFWTVNGATTLGAGTKFAGTVMGTAAISVGAGARVEGRLLARAGAITLDSNAIRTACAEPEIVVGPAGPAGLGRPVRSRRSYGSGGYCRCCGSCGCHRPGGRQRRCGCRWRRWR